MPAVKCKHNKRRPLCKECGGGGLCVHGKRKERCKDCKGGSICGHGKRRYSCQECKGTGICVHGRSKDRCKYCGGKRRPVKHRDGKVAAEFFTAPTSAGWTAISTERVALAA